MVKGHVSCSPHRQEALLAAISEKDANIALLELSSSKKKKTQDEVALLKREKDRLVQQLKQQVGVGFWFVSKEIQGLLMLLQLIFPAPFTGICSSGQREHRDFGVFA